MRGFALFRRRRPPGRHAAQPSARDQSVAELAGPPPATRQPAMSPAAVRLGFADGSEIELDQNSGASEALRDAARRIID